MSDKEYIAELEEIVIFLCGVYSSGAESLAVQESGNSTDDKWWDDLLDRAASGEVVKIQRNGTIFYLGTRQGVSDGEKRVLDAAVSMGYEMGRYKQRIEAGDAGGAA